MANNNAAGGGGGGMIVNGSGDALELDEWWRSWISLIKTVVDSAIDQEVEDMNIYLSGKKIRDAGAPPGNSNSNTTGLHLRNWAVKAGAEILSSSGSDCKQIKTQVLQFLANDILGISILFQNMKESNRHSVATQNALSQILREIANPKHGKLRGVIVKQAIDLIYLPCSIKIIKELILSRVKCEKVPEDVEVVESSLTNFLWFFSALATNDSSFASQVREQGKVKWLLNDVYKKLFFAKPNAHYPLLKILRTLAKSELTAGLLGKEGAMSTIRKSITTLGTMPGGKLLLLTEILSLLTRRKLNCTRFLKAGLVPKILQCFTVWELWRGKGLLKFAKYVVSSLSNVCRRRSGCKAVVKGDGVMTLRKFADACPSERAFDDIIMRIGGLFATCFAKDALPLESLESPLKFAIPEEAGSSRIHVDTGSSSDDEGSEEDEEDDEDEDGDIDEEEEDDDDGSCSPEEEDNNDDSVAADDYSSQIILPGTSKINMRRRSSSKRLSLGRKLSLGAGVDAILPSYNFSPDYNYRRYRPYFSEFETSIRRRTSVTSSKLIDANGNEVAVVPNSKDNKTLSIPRSDHKYPWLSANKECSYVYWASKEELYQNYVRRANTVSHVAPFVKIPYPDLAFGHSLRTSEPMLGSHVERSVLRYKLGSYMTRVVGGESFKSRIIYSLDALLKDVSSKRGELRNTDEADVGRYYFNKGLEFEARFECGNLRKVIQIGEREYDLLITSDVNSRHHNQWFYFHVGNTVTEKSYTFNIINCTKTNSQFNFGMQPMVFSVMEAMKGRPGWVRSGSDICYYKNGYKLSPKAKKSSNKKKGSSSRVYRTLSFNLTFSHKGDIVYVAYFVPYTYTRLMVELDAMIKATEGREDLSVRCDTLCTTLNKNDVPLLTITSSARDPDETRDIVFLTSRVHPGETNASWVMKGILEFLLFGKTLHSKFLLRKYVFKVVPMLNEDGVINGCHRCGLTAEDLNRCWKSPSEIFHPEIYHTKMLIEYCCKTLTLPPTLYVDLHGHSRRKNWFFYGCSKAKSWNCKDKTEPDDGVFLKSLAESVAKVSPTFCTSHCNYDVKKGRETTARVAIWRDYKIPRSYTLEASYCGADRGACKGVAFGTNHLLEIGRDFCKACLDL